MVGQTRQNSSTLIQQADRLDWVDVVVCRTSAQNRLQQNFSLEHVARCDHQLTWDQTDFLAVVVHSLTDLDEHLLKRGLAEVGCGGQLVAKRTVHDRVSGVDQAHAVATDIRTVERTVEHVCRQRLFGLNQRLSKVTSVDVTDTDVVAVLNQHFRQREGKAIHVVDVALEEEHTTLLVRNRGSVRQLWRRAETVQDGLFVVVAGDTLLLAENPRPLVGTLIIDSVETLVEDWLNNRTEVRTAHWGCHFLALLRMR